MLNGWNTHFGLIFQETTSSCETLRANLVRPYRNFDSSHVMYFEEVPILAKRELH